MKLLKKYFGEAALSIFIDVPSFETLKDRLESRGSEADKDIQERINKDSIREKNLLNKSENDARNDDDF